MGARYTVDPGIRAMLKDLGLPPGRILRRAQLPGDLFRGDPVALSEEEYFRLWDAIDAEGNDPSLAVAIGQAVSVEMFSPPLFAALCSPNLSVAARRIATYKPLIGPTALDIAEGKHGLTITYRWPAGSAPPQLLAMIELVFWAALARIATRHDVRAVKVTASRLPVDPDGVADYFGVRLHKGSTESVTFSAEDAARPFLTENESMWTFFAPELRRRLTDLEAAATTTDRVHAALLETLPAGDSTMTTVTRHLATSPRTLQRQLQLEGTTYQAVLADTRERLARHYLANGDMSIGEIAYMLAYEDTNSFYRAFRTWTGSTPEQVRTAPPVVAPA